MEYIDSTLLENLIQIQGVSSDETSIKEYLKKYVLEQSKKWKAVPEILDGPGFQDTLTLVFGQPRVAIYAHIDTIGFSVGYNKELIKIGGPRLIDGTALVGKDSKGEIEAELMLIDDEHGNTSINYVCEREIDRGTLLSFKPNFRTSEEFIQSPYLDNRLGVYAALKVAETLEHGAIVFGTYEEHGGNSVGNCARYLLHNYRVLKALICDITWVTEGVKHGGGVAISMRDSMLPRRKYLNRILEIVQEENFIFQLEVESAGGSDGSVLQKSDLPIDWCFIGAPEDNVHTPDEKVFKKDILSMIEIYRLLMQKL